MPPVSQTVAQSSGEADTTSSHTGLLIALGVLAGLLVVTVGTVLGLLLVRRRRSEKRRLVCVLVRLVWLLGTDFWHAQDTALASLRA